MVRGRGRLTVEGNGAIGERNAWIATSKDLLGSGAAPRNGFLRHRDGRASRGCAWLRGHRGEVRNKAAELGGNYVRVMGMSAPHPAGGCYDDRFVIIGDVFRVTASAQAAAEPAGTDSCSPPCSPGYACQAGVCRAQCNPACGADQVCRQDRTCGPASP